MVGRLPEPDPPLEPVRTPTEEKLLVELTESQEGHGGVALEE
jgi:hypothetical protein